MPIRKFDFEDKRAREVADYELAKIKEIMRTHKSKQVQMRNAAGQWRSFFVLCAESGSAEGESSLPFTVNNRSPDAATPTVGVSEYSYLRRSLAAAGSVGITGLEKLGANGKYSNTFSVSLGTLIWLDISLTEGNIEKAEIKHGITPWAGYPEAIAIAKVPATDDSPEKLGQTHAYVALAKIVKQSDDIRGAILPQKLMVDQLCHSSLAMVTLCYDGIAPQYPIPHVSPVP